MAGWEKGPVKNGKQFLYAPVMEAASTQLTIEDEA